MRDDLREVVEVAREREFGKLKGQLAEECRSCRHLALCRGGCPKDRLACDGKDAAARSWLCEGYRTFFERFGADLESVADEIRREIGHQRREHRRGATAEGVGRNDPCPCGSGRKFKHCCGR